MNLIRLEPVLSRGSRGDSVGASKFRSLAASLAALLQEIGYNNLPYHDETLPYFSQLSLLHQEQVTDELAAFVEVCQHQLATRESLNYHKMLFWRMLGRLHVRPLATLMEEISESDIIEIYDLSCRQVFRSMNFMAVCSYPVEDLLCRPFFQLFKREEEVTNVIFASSIKTVTAGQRETQAVPTGTYTIEEIDAPEKRQSVVENILMSPLFNEAGQIQFVVATIRCYASTATTSLL